MIVETQTIRTSRNRRLERGVWHNFGGPCSYRVAPKRDSYSIRLDNTGEIVKPGGPAGQDALGMAMFMEGRAETYERYAFGSRAIDAAETFAKGDAIIQKYLGDPK